MKFSSLSVSDVHDHVSIIIYTVHTYMHHTYIHILAFVGLPEMMDASSSRVSSRPYDDHHALFLFFPPRSSETYVTLDVARKITSYHYTVVIS
jgi:hypothetical protein